MEFNGSKFEMLRYTPVNAESGFTYYAPDGNPIKQTQFVRDLGIMMQDTASFDQQIDNVVEKGKIQASWVMRAFATRETKPLLILYKSLVLPHLEYCSQLWSPSGIGNIRKLEEIQRSYTSKVLGVSGLDYWERLKKLNLFSLERRRDRYTILYVYKILIGIVPNLQDERFRVEARDSQRLGIFCKIPSLSTRATCRIKTMVDSSFAVRGARLFNSLPKDIRNHNGSFDSFKGRLDKLLGSIPDKPFLPNYPTQNVQSNSVIHQIACIHSNM